MTHAKITIALPAALLALGLATSPAFAAPPGTHSTLLVKEGVGKVEATWSGAFDLTGLSNLYDGNLANHGFKFYGGSNYEINIGANSGPSDRHLATLSFNSGASTGTEYGFVGAFAFGSPVITTGTMAGIWSDPSVPGNGLRVSSSYVSGNALDGYALFSGNSLSSMGLTAGKYVWNYGSGGLNSVTIDVQGAGGGAVPEPGEWAAMGILGAGLAGLVIRKRKKA